MTDLTNQSGAASLSLSAESRIDRQCLAFEDAWKAGNPKPIEPYLSDLTDTECTALLRELVTLEVFYRHQCGESPTLEEYQARFAGDAQTVAEAFRGLPVQLQRARSLEIGQRIGRYRVLDWLGQGGFGAVWLAEDDELCRKVAIKLPRIDRFGPNEMQQFMEEARAIARCKCPGIVSIYDVGRLDDGSVFLVMEYVEGRSLRDTLRSGRLSADRAVELIAAIADAVNHAHQLGFVHRDLDPGNVLIDAEGRPHVADFGLALHESSQRQRADECAGSVSYMAPEQVRGESHRLDGRADLWAMGVILYEMLTGRLPFGGQSAEEVADEILHREPKPARQIDPSVPAALARICQKCLSKDVTGRYATAGDLAHDLRRWRRPRRLWATVAVAGSLLGVVALSCFMLWSPHTLPVSGNVTLLVYNENEESQRGSKICDVGAAVPLRANDAVRVIAEVSRPCYLHVFWIDGDGTTSPIHPWNNESWSELPKNESALMRLNLPATSPVEWWPMRPGQDGMETLILAARDKPLPPNVKIEALFADLPKQESPDFRRVAWFENGFLIADRLSDTRGADTTKTVRVRDPLGEYQRLIAQRLSPHFTLIRSVCFARQRD